LDIKRKLFLVLDEVVYFEAGRGFGGQDAAIRATNTSDNNGIHGLSMSCGVEKTDNGLRESAVF
jgi:hypothetical protein